MSGILGTSSNVQVSESGKLYIYKGVTQDYFEDTSNKPDGFRAGIDFMVGDYISQADPNIHTEKKAAFRKEETDKASEGQNRAATVFQRLVSAGKRLLRVIEHNEGGANKDLAKFADQINALCDKWDN